MEIGMKVEQRAHGILGGFLNSLDRFADRPALIVAGRELTYAGLFKEAMSLSAAITACEEDRQPLVALLAARSETAYAGLLGILGSGKGYVPLNPKFPVERTRSMLRLSGCTTLIAGKEAVSQLLNLLGGDARPMTVILPDTAPDWRLASTLSQHRLIFADDIPTAEPRSFAEIDPAAIAYLLFTSGSTGVPKGVPIHHANVRPYIEYVCDRYQVSHEDRLSQEFDLTFDLSVHDMFVCWERGASLFVVPEKSVMAPAKFIREHGLTMWFSVPSVIGLLSRMKLLRPNAFPTLRCSLFCGEPLSASYAQLWQEAAPHSLIENLYGPTETTIAITRYRWDAERSPNECVNGVVPIGWPFDGQQACIIDQNSSPVAPGATGELCLSGSQITTGYWNNPEKTREQFIRVRESGESLWYRTGDIVRQDGNGCLVYLGRTDQQIKIRGYRVELQEIEAVLRKLCGTEQVASLPWPVREGRADGVVAFVAGAEVNLPGILAACSEFLPDYMVPKAIYPVEDLPLSPNGKVDRVRLSKMLEGMEQ
jgi:amino acid adenylation domain-containing protein